MDWQCQSWMKTLANASPRGCGTPFAKCEGAADELEPGGVQRNRQSLTKPVFEVPSWCVCVVVCCRVRVCVSFTCAGIECAPCFRLRSGEKSPPLLPSERERQCALPRTSLVSTSSSVDHERCRAGVSSVGPLRLNLLRSLITLWVEKKRLGSCQPLRVCSLSVDSTERHLCTPFARWGARASCLSSVWTHQGIPPRIPLIKSFG